MDRWRKVIKGSVASQSQHRVRGNTPCHRDNFTLKTDCVGGPLNRSMDVWSKDATGMTALHVGM